MKEINKALLGLVLFFLMLVMGCFQYFSENASELTLMTFNVRHRDEHVDKYAWDVRSKEIVATVREHLPDILAVQELNDRSWFGAKPATDSVQAFLLEGLSDYFHVYLNSRDPALYRADCLAEDGNLRNGTPKAIFFNRYRFTCLKAGSTRLLGEIIEGQQVSRYASWVILTDKWDSDKAYFVVNTHLAAGDNAEIRQIAAGQLVSVVREKSRYGGEQLPIILMGDLNDTPDSLTLDTFKEGLQLNDTYTGSGYTYSSWSKLKVKLDYILVSSGLAVASSEIVHYTNLAASDHLPVKSTLDVR